MTGRPSWAGLGLAVGVGVGAAWGIVVATLMGAPIAFGLLWGGALGAIGGLVLELMVLRAKV